MSRRVVSIVVCGVLATATTASAQTIAYYKFTPAVVPQSYSQPVLFEAEVTGQATRVTLDFQPGQLGTVTVLELRDDGTGGDRRAGDNTWSVQLPVAPLLAARRADDVQRVFAGFVNVFSGSTNVLRGNMFVPIYTTDLGTPSVSRLSQFVQATSRVVNIHDAAYFVDRSLTRVTREFYGSFGDDYDFLNVVYEPSRFANRTHFQTRNDIQGIGLTIFNNTAQYGSAGRLQGISQFPIGNFFDGAETGHIHELGHQWINFLNFPPLAAGMPHWPLSSMAGGVMGFSIGGTGGQGGSFRCDARDENGTVILGARPDAPPFNPLDLYLMGLLPADQVGTQIVFVDQPAAQSLQCNGQAFTGAVTRLTIQDVIARYGPRSPAAGDAPTRFRVATILVTRDGLASQEEMWLYTHFAERGELRTRVPTHSGFVKELGRPFYLATGERATLEMSVEAAGADFSLVATPTSRTVAAGTPALFTISAMPVRSSYDTPVRFSCASLPANAACAFDPVEVTPGANGRDVNVTIATRAPQAEGVRDGVVSVLALIWLAVLIVATSMRRARSFRPALAALLLGAALACGGGTGPAPPSPQPPPSGLTSPGTYQVTVTGTSGGVQRSATVSLTIQ